MKSNALKGQPKTKNVWAERGFYVIVFLFIPHPNQLITTLA